MKLRNVAKTTVRVYNPSLELQPGEVSVDLTDNELSSLELRKFIQAGILVDADSVKEEDIVADERVEKETVAIEEEVNDSKEVVNDSKEVVVTEREEKSDTKETDNEDGGFFRS